MKALLFTLLYVSLFLLPLAASALPLPIPQPHPESLEHLVESLIGVGGHPPHQHFVQADDPGLHHRRDLHPHIEHPLAIWGDSPEGAPLLPRDDLETGDEDWQPWIQSDNPDKFIRRDDELAYPEDAAPVLPRGVDATRLVYRRAPRPDQLSADDKSYGQPWTGSTGSDNPDLNRRDDLSATEESYGQPWAGSDNPNVNRRDDGVDATQAPIILDRDEDFRNHSPSPVLIHNPQSDGTSNGDDEADEANLKCQPGGPSSSNNNAKFAPTGLLRPTLSTIVKPNQPFLVMYCTPTYHAMRSMGWDVLAYNSNSTGMGRLLATGVKGDSTHVTVDDPYYDRLAVYERQNGVAGNMFAMATRNLVFDHGDGGNGGQDGGQPKVTKQGITLAGANVQNTNKEAVRPPLDEFSNNQHTKSDALAIHKTQQAADEAAAVAEEHVKDATHKVKAAEKHVAHGQAPSSALKAAEEAKHAATNAEQAALPASLKAVKEGEDAAQVAGQDVVGAAAEKSA